ncbi:uncharacterized protein LOC133890284 [Phragmites australis]|uniref:uncharacterized protein LOC133890284 n=1 Tax=Phragmites australis TaxID=29695 RepID=UPI002D7A0DE5|nr:uncharacterized protein LOC133890284 [Phragmites australis]
MVMPPRSSSSGMRSIRRELQRRRPKPLAPTRPAAKKPSAPPQPREAARDKVQETRPRPPRVEDPSSTTSQSRGSAGTTHAPPPHRPRPDAPPRSSVASPSTPPPSRSSASSTGSACAATPGVTAHLKPGTAVLVRTRTAIQAMGKAVVLWLPATVVQPTDGGYEVVYKGKLPREDPYATVHIARDHVRVQKPSTTTPPPSQPPSSAASSYASATTTMAAACKSSEMHPAPRPTTAGKSLRLVRNLASEMERQSRAALSGY